MVTIREIAERMGLSAATVSRALNGDSKISRETQMRVKAVADELGYVTCSVGRRKKDPSSVVGIICPEVVSNNYSATVEALSKSLKQKGFSSVFMITNMNTEDEINALKLFKNLGVAGIVMISYDDESTIAALDSFKKENSIPIVQIMNFESYAECDSLMISNTLAAKMIADHLTSLGHKDIAIVTDGRAAARKNALTEAFSAIGIAPRVIDTGEFRFEEGGSSAAKEILKGDSLPSAIVATYDYMAVGVMKALSDAGVRVPDDISVAGIDNIRTSEYTSKGLTTVSMPHTDIGQIAARILVDRINTKNRRAVQHVNVNPELIIRDSTKSIKS